MELAPNKPFDTRRLSLSSRLESHRQSGSPGRASQTPASSIRLRSSTSSFAPSLPSEALNRHTDLWFPDGSVVLRAENMLFRVHQSQLSRHSGFFRDLFSLPQPPADPNVSVVDDCPTIYLHDAPEDVGYLLKALYDGPTFGGHGYEDFKRIAGILRLSTKYLVDTLRAKALAHLRIAWPSTLKSWDAREDHARSSDIDGTFYPNPVAIINLAREIDAPSLLQSAFYDLSRWSYNAVFEQWEADPSNSPFPQAFLLPADMRKLMLGKEASQQTITTLIQSMGSARHQRHHQHHTTPSVSHHPSSSSPPHRDHQAARRMSCTTAAACRKDFEELVELSTQHYLFDRERGSTDPLYVAEELGQLKSSDELGQLKIAEGAEFSECRACARSLELWATREREKIWRSILAWFKLDEYSGVEI